MNLRLLNKKRQRKKIPEYSLVSSGSFYVMLHTDGEASNYWNNKWDVANKTHDIRAIERGSKQDKNGYVFHKLKRIARFNLDDHDAKSFVVARLIDEINTYIIVSKKDFKQGLFH